MFSIWKLHIVWKDYWCNNKGLEISWGEKVLFVKGFKEK